MNDEHTRPTQKIPDSVSMAAAGVGRAMSQGPFRRPRAPFGSWIEPWQMWCIVAAAIGAAGGVGWAGSLMHTNQTLACMKAEEASHQEKGRLMDLEFSHRREQERQENDEANRHLQAIRECHKEGNIPVLGYNYAVVCLERPHVVWTHSSEDPLPWL